MLNCKEVTDLCSNELDRPLTLGERLTLHAHLMMCSGCTNYRAQLQTLRDAMLAYAEGKAPEGDPAAPRPGDPAA